MLKGCVLPGIAFLLLSSVLPAVASDTSSCSLRDARATGGNIIYVLCAEGTVMSSNDAGAKWTLHQTNATERLRAMAFIDQNRGVVVGDNGLMLATDDGGKTWQVRKTNTTEALRSVTFVGESGWVAGYSGLILHSDDGGKTWSPQNSNTTLSLENVFFVDAQHGWAVGWVGTIVRTDDGGKTWEAIKSDAANWELSSIFFRDPQNGWAVGFQGQILRSKDGGKTWTALKSPMNGWLTCIRFDSDNRGWITSDDNLLVSKDGGETWERVMVEDRLYLTKLARINGGLWAIGPYRVLKQTGDGLKWDPVENVVPSLTDVIPTEAADGAIKQPQK